MLKWIMAGCVASVVLPVSALAQGACAVPEKPKMPINGAILSAAELDNAADMVSQYSKTSRVYQGCLDKVISKPETHSREEWRAALKAYNSAAPGVEEVWDTYQKLSDDWVKAHLTTKKTTGK